MNDSLFRLVTISSWCWLFDCEYSLPSTNGVCTEFFSDCDPSSLMTIWILSVVEHFFSSLGSCSCSCSRSRSRSWTSCSFELYCLFDISSSNGMLSILIDLAISFILFCCLAFDSRVIFWMSLCNFLYFLTLSTAFFLAISILVVAGFTSLLWSVESKLIEIENDSSISLISTNVNL